MQSSYLRTFVSGLVTACFALSVLTRAVMPGCITPTDNTPAAHAPVTHHHHSDDGPGSSHQSVCPTHLCCINVSAPLVAGVAVATLVLPPQSGGFASLVSVIADRSPHVLPFATAPPLSVS